MLINLALIPQLLSTIMSQILNKKISIDSPTSSNIFKLIKKLLGCLLLILGHPTVKQCKIFLSKIQEKRLQKLYCLI